jgi:riboflavin synthase
MFTGIVAAVGRIESVMPEGDGPDAGVRLIVDPGALPLDDVRIGDSIALQGACMTVVSLDGARMTFDVSRESLNRTAGLGQAGHEVNLEKALRAHDRLGGHMVAGHVDGIGTVTRFAPVGESHELRVRASRKISRFLAYKGSVTVNGVSLTVNAVVDGPQDCEFSINLIPHTVAATTLKHIGPGVPVNLEVDLVARYVERLMNAPRPSD